MNKIKKILVVDDSTTSVLLMQEILTENGFDIYKALNGKKALMILEKIKPDIILLDIMMPLINGYEVLEALNANIEMSSIPVIVISARGEKEDVKKAFDLGANEYITKPININSLLKKINNLLSD